MHPTVPVAAYAYCDSPNPLEQEIMSALERKAEELAHIREGRYTRSQDIEKCLQQDFVHLGFARSATVKGVAGLFAAWSDFEIDFFHPELNIAIEVEKGKHYNLWRNVVKFCESPIIAHAALIVPYQREGAQGPEAVFSNTLESLKNIETLYERMSSLLCFGY